MDEARLRTISDGFQRDRIAVLGDFFLDRYLFIDPSKEEISLETGLPAHQVVDKRNQPGAAGTVSSNLSALGVGTIHALGVIGNDGEGFELLRGLNARRVLTDLLIVDDHRFTPTYTKPMRRNPEGDVEMERQDIKNHTPLLPALEDEIIRRLKSLLPNIDAVIMLDQVEERNCGVLTDRVRSHIAEIAEEWPNTFFFADSRSRIDLFRNVCIKPNRLEAARAMNPGLPMEVEAIPDDTAMKAAQELAKRNHRTVFLTLNEKGIAVATPESVTHVPGVKVTGPIDIVGAGDSVTAGVVSALAAGGTFVEAANVGNLVASVTIRQLGTTGTCTIPQLIEAFQAARELYASI